MFEHSLDCRGLNVGEKEAYLEFARQAWGKNAPQADPALLDWLYANPKTQGIGRDLIVLSDAGQIVGTQHRMRIPWVINGQALVVSSLHDLYVRPSYRHASKGAGLMPPSLQLMVAALEGELQAVLCGLSQDSEAIYKGMGLPSVPLFWLQKTRGRALAALQITASWLGRRNGIHPELARAESTWRDCEVSRIPSPTFADLKEALGLKPEALSFPDWDCDSYSWRFFHELGPKNILILARRRGRLVGRLVVSIGLKRGLRVARISDLVFEDWIGLEALLLESEAFFSDVAASVCLAVTNSRQTAERFVKSGWAYRKKVIGSRWFSRIKSNKPSGLWISGGAWDFGCDARIAR